MFNASNTYHWLASIADTLKYALAAALLGMLLAGCASSQKREANHNQEAKEMGLLLISAGFQMKVADTPEKLERLKTLPQRKFIQHQRNGKNRYLYAYTDPCKCIYTGDKEAYQRYQELAREKALEEEQGRRDGMGIWREDAGFYMEEIGQGRWKPWW